jgi:hypothetical protein
MAKPDKKRRRELKRKEKRLAIRKRESVSPVKRLADAPGELECWMSKEFEVMGQASAFCYKRAAGLTGVACFLVDRGVVGLKDAWIQLNVDYSRFEEMLEISASRGIVTRQVPLDQVRNLVAGGVRWATENGMRLPKDWMRAAAFIGGIGDYKSADVSQFVKEFAGHPEDLRQRLIGETLETYLRRTDIRFIFSDAAPYMDPKTGEYVDLDQIGTDEFDDDEFDDDEFDDEPSDGVRGATG